jgi:FKBP-type peptidyl-prolyl cis-trans isomerase FklB
MKKYFVVALNSLAVALLLCSVAQAQSSSSGPQTPSSSLPAAPVARKPAAAGSTPAAKPATGTASKPSAQTELKTDLEKGSYAVGLNLGARLKQQPIELDLPSLFRGIKDSTSGAKPLLTEAELDAALKELGGEAQAKLADNNLKSGQAYLAANKTKDGVVTLPSGLQYKMLTTGTGPKPVKGDTVSCNYRGTFIDGTEFDSTAKRGGKPAEFQVGGVIPGWNEALELMPVGSKWQLVIPPDLAYGPGGAAPVIGPNQTLVFEVELLSIKPKP